MENTFNNIDNNVTMDNDTLSKWEKITGRMDTIVIIATILYYTRVVNVLGGDILYNGTFDYFHFIDMLAANTGALGISLLVFSITTFAAIIWFAVMKRISGKMGLLSSATVIIWNALWIVGDAYLLYLVLV